jgi:hypothetical protein
MKASSLRLSQIIVIEIVIPLYTSLLKDDNNAG